MIALGSQEVKALYLGGQKIVKAYLGGAEVFGSGAGSSSRLPEGYTEVEYIQSTGSEYINFSLAGSILFSSIVRIDAELVNSCLFYSSYRTSTTATAWYRYGIWANSTSKSVFGALGATSYATIASFDPGERAIFILDGINKTFIYKENSATVTKATSYQTYLGGGRLLQNVNITQQSVGPVGTYSVNTSPTKIYSVQISNNTGVFHDYVPCIDPTGAVGLYDLVGEKFYGNSGTGAFMAGPAI